MTLYAFIRKYYKKCSKEQKIIILLLSFFISMLLAVKCIETIINLSSKQKHINPPLLTREGETIFIPQGSPLRQTLQLITIHPSSKPHMLSFVGFVEADPKYILNLYAPVNGRIDQILVNLGETVKKGQPLIKMISGDFATARSALEKAESTLLLAKKIRERAEAVQTAGGNTLETVEIAKDQWSQAQSEVMRAKNQLESLSMEKTAQFTLYAPIDGQITNLYYGEGAFVTNASNYPLLTLSNIDDLWVTAYVPEHLIGFLSTGQEVTLQFPVLPHIEYKAHINFINAYIEPESRRNKTRILVKNPQHILQPNMFSTIYIPIAQPNMISIPLSSILMNDDIVSVFVEIKPWTFVRREVYLGMEDGDAVRVLSGLKSGERIVSTGGIFIND